LTIYFITAAQVTNSFMCAYMGGTSIYIAVTLPKKFCFSQNDMFMRHFSFLMIVYYVLYTKVIA